MKKKETDLKNKIEDSVSPRKTNTYGGYSYVLDYPPHEDDVTAEEKKGLYSILLAMVAVFTVGVLCIAAVIIADIFKNAKAPLSPSNGIMYVESSHDTDSFSQLPMLSDRLAERCSDFTVSICADNEGDSTYGTGTVITSDGYIITCSDVVGDRTTVNVTVNGGEHYRAKVIGIDPACEIAVIKIHGSFTAATFQAGECVQGTDVAAMLRIYGSKNVHGARMGKINSAEYTITQFFGTEKERTLNVISTDINTQREMCGAPLVNCTGKVVGVMVNCGDDTGAGYAVSADRILPVIYRMVSTYAAEKNNSDHDVLPGVVGIDVTAESSDKFNIPRGILITGVNSYSPAVCAGLAKGDIIVAFDKVSVMSIACLKAEVDDYHDGDDVTVKVYRKGKILELSFKL